MSTRFIVAAAAVASALGSAPLRAQEQPIQLALVAPVQLVPEGRAIRGLRLDLLYGRNTAVTGLDVGLVNHTTRGPSAGLQYGLVNLAGGDFTGWQASLVGVTQGRFTGLQSGAVNSAGSGSGVQWGMVNVAETMHGLQFGFVNVARRMNKGVQIGLVNIIREGGQFPIFPIVNWSF